MLLVIIITSMIQNDGQSGLGFCNSCKPPARCTVAFCCNALWQQCLHRPRLQTMGTISTAFSTATSRVMLQTMEQHGARAGDRAAVWPGGRQWV